MILGYLDIVNSSIYLFIFKYFHESIRNLSFHRISDESFFILQMKKYSQEFLNSLKFHEYIFTLVIS